MDRLRFSLSLFFYQIKYSVTKIKAVTRRTKDIRQLRIEQNRAANRFQQASFPFRDWIRWLLGNRAFMRTFYMIVIWNMIAVGMFALITVFNHRLIVVGT